jgi:hypothetical protein
MLHIYWVHGYQDLDDIENGSITRIQGSEKSLTGIRRISAFISRIRRSDGYLYILYPSFIYTIVIQDVGLGAGRERDVSRCGGGGGGRG